MQIVDFFILNFLVFFLLLSFTFISRTCQHFLQFFCYVILQNGRALLPRNYKLFSIFPGSWSILHSVLEWIRIKSGVTRMKSCSSKLTEIKIPPIRFYSLWKINKYLTQHTVSWGLNCWQKMKFLGGNCRICFVNYWFQTLMVWPFMLWWFLHWNYFCLNLA